MQRARDEATSGSRWYLSFVDWSGVRAIKDSNTETSGSGIMYFEPPEIAPILVFSAGSYSRSSG